MPKGPLFRSLRTACLAVAALLVMSAAAAATGTAIYAPWTFMHAVASANVKMNGLDSVALGFTPAPKSVVVPAHVLALYADLDSPAASRAMVVVRAFVERHPGVAAVEIHANPPAGRPRPVDRVLIAAQSLNAGLPMAELILANADRRSPQDFLAMARQLQLNEAQFSAAVAGGGADPVIAADVAAASMMQLSRGVALLIDGQPVFASLTLSDLELRLTSHQK